MSAADFNDRDDFADADKGFVAAMDPCIVKAENGRVVWDNDAYSFLDADCPDTASPSLWRQSQLCAKQGLYQVTDGIYQVRGLDLSNMTLVEGDTGVIVIDPLISKETAAAALALYRQHRGDREVTAVIYTHAHVDHFGGVHGVYKDGVPVVAGHGFVESAVAENVYAGTAMNRRATYMYGATLDKGPAGQIGAGLGQTTSAGSIGLIPPTLEITHTGQEETLDGVLVRFQMTPGTECPVEMNFLFPERRALCMAENATHNLHNLLTLRGAVVRDARVWSRYLGEAIALFAADADVAFASHHWPTWSRDRIVTYLSAQRDLYAYLHDQTLRLLNAGYTGPEIAEMMEVPPALDEAWHTHGYYGSVSHNVKAIYQRYLGWFDGNPAHLWQHPPAEAATRYVECLGGAESAITKAKGYIDSGDRRFAAELLNHVVFADDSNMDARHLLADTYESLGFGAENGTWRNFYLQGADELRRGIKPVPMDVAGASGLVAALSLEQLFDAIAVRINGPRCWTESFAIDWVFTDVGHTYRITLTNGVLIHEVDPATGSAALTVALAKPQFLQLLTGAAPGDLSTTGDVSLLQRLLSFLDAPSPNFAIVTP
ncbi:MAG TPA: alkyl sulfatase dimerization domain-containing protein [Acidimicrobiales bacterium]|jgi:alkyl sulfatase BDS1-like metallo-beta-lactamase superfamily hydrolase|nr:alkyl sulfatase dimerization domain-containing protein [Acidimicrobiales bacterium]